jgi:transposase-like protein
MDGRDREKRREWGERLKRFEEKGGGAAEFCRQEGVSTASFYAWRRRLKGEEQGSDERGSKPRDEAEKVEFVPLAIAEERRPATIEIELANGVKVKAAGDAEALAVVIAAAARLPREARPC